MSTKERLYRFRSFWIFPLLAFSLLYTTSRHESQERLHTFYWLFPLGLLLWTLLEYTLHRFAFHIQAPIRNLKLREFLNASHLGHHAAPRDPTKVFVHSSFAIIISAVLFGLIYAAAGAFTAATIMAGVWTGFLYYEAVHYRVHFSLSASGVVAWQRRAHFYHHFTNNKKCFGVTSAFWDYVFGTRRPEPVRSGRSLLQ